MVQIYLDKLILLADSPSSLFNYPLRGVSFYLFSVPADSVFIRVPMPAASTVKH
jgi:hypothetical protein